MLFPYRINQIRFWISSIPVAVFVQFSGRFLLSVVGSKIENTFPVIFSLFFGMWRLVVWWQFTDFLRNLLSLVTADSSEDSVNLYRIIFFRDIHMHVNFKSWGLVRVYEMPFSAISRQNFPKSFPLISIRSPLQHYIYVCTYMWAHIVSGWPVLKLYVWVIDYRYER
jgi:hypothetical protein